MLRDGACRGDRGGSAFWGEPGFCPQPIPGSELCSELLQHLFEVLEMWLGGAWCVQHPPPTGRAESSPTITPLTVNISETFTWYFFLSI